MCQNSRLGADRGSSVRIFPYLPEDALFVVVFAAPRNDKLMTLIMKSNIYYANIPFLVDFLLVFGAESLLQSKESSELKSSSSSLYLE